MVAVKNPCQAAEGDMAPSNKFLWLWREICVEHAVIATVNERTNAAAVMDTRKTGS